MFRIEIRRTYRRTKIYEIFSTDKLRIFQLLNFSSSQFKKLKNESRIFGLQMKNESRYFISNIKFICCVLNTVQYSLYNLYIFEQKMFVKKWIENNNKENEQKIDYKM